MSLYLHRKRNRSVLCINFIALSYVMFFIYFVEYILNIIFIEFAGFYLDIYL